MHNEEWSEVVATTTPEYLRGAADMTIRERVVFAMLQKRKRILYGQAGTELRWQAKFSLPEVEAYTGQTLDFAPSDKHRQLAIDWRGYVVTDMMTEKEKLMNRGPQALIRRYEGIFPDMEQSLTETFASELYIDGNTYTDRFHGLETFLGSGTTVAADRIAKPSATYAGYATNVGAIAGSWSANLAVPNNASIATDWPDGNGDPEYDWWAPRMLNTSSTSWIGAGSTSWIDTCEYCIRQGILWSTLTTGKQGRPDMVLLSPDWYYQYLNKQSAKQRIIVPHKEMQDLGFEGVQQEGVGITHEFGMPSTTGYMLNLDKMQLHIMYDQLFMSKGPEFDMRTVSYLFSIGTFGNWRYISPKFFCKLYPYA